MSKKGDVLLVKVLLGILISIPLLLILLYVGNSLFGLIAQQDNSEDFFNEFFQTIEIGMAKENQKEIIYFVEEGSFLIGFLQDKTPIEGFNKPAAEDKCEEGKTCLCLCKESDENSCLRASSICYTSNIYKNINGIFIEADNVENENLKGLLIKGRTKLPIKLIKTEDTLAVKTADSE